MSLSANYPTVRPSLLLDFANSKRLDPRITFTRATTATYYDGSTTAMAEQNLLLSSTGYSHASNISATLSPNNTTAPDGTSTAVKLTPTTANDRHIIYQYTSTGAYGSGQAITASAYVKAGGYNYAQLGYFQDGGGASAGIVVDLTDGSIDTVNGTLASYSVTSVGSGWYRLIITFVTTFSSGVGLIVAASNSGTPGAYSAGSPQFTGDGTSAIYYWGIQMEVRSSATAYTATTTQPITNYIPVLLTAGGGQPRFDYNPITSVSLGLAIEPQRTNLLLNSAAFGSWSATNGNPTISSNVIVAPDGTVSGDKFIPGTANGYQLVYQVAASSGTYTFSAYAKAGEYNHLMLWTDSPTTFGTSVFNLTNGTIVQTGTGHTNLIITSVGNGWYRCSITAATISATPTFYIGIAPNGNTGGTFAGDGFSGGFLWGAQLEAGSFATSYIATTSAAVTRAAETVTMSAADTAAILDINQGVMLVEATLPPTGGYDISTFACGIGYSSNDYLGLLYAGTGYFQPTHGGFGPTSDPEVAGTLNKGAMSWSGTSGTVPTAYAQNGQVSNTGNGNGGLTCFAKYPNLTYLSIGYAAFDTALATRKRCWIGKVAVYPQAATSAQLQALTA